MNFANKSLKDKIKKSLDLFSITIVSFIALLLLFYNIRGFYYSHKVYKVDLKTASELKGEYIHKDIKEILENINLIENNKGIYTNEEYKLISEFVNDIKQSVNKDIEVEMSSKNKLTVKDFNKFFDNMTIYDIYGYDGLNNYRNIYKTILKYDIDKYDNMLRYNSTQRLYLNCFEELSQIHYPIYKYGYTLNEYVLYENYINVIINLKYTSYRLILNDIVEVGDINE